MYKHKSHDASICPCPMAYRSAMYYKKHHQNRASWVHNRFFDAVMSDIAAQHAAEERKAA